VDSFSDYRQQQQEQLPQQDVDPQLLVPDEAPVSGKATASRTELISSTSKSRSRSFRLKSTPADILPPMIWVCRSYGDYGDSG
jgi:hypothetical protein